MSIQENIAAVRQNIERAAKEVGRSADEITLVGASKMNGADACREAIAAGIDALGENRVQELVEKRAQGAYEGAPLHFIGHLQTNKVKQVVGVADLIQSVDSEELLARINALGVGPQGFGGKTTALAVNIETAPTHIAGLPVAVNINCHVTRHKSEVL